MDSIYLSSSFFVPQICGLFYFPFFAIFSAIDYIVIHRRRLRLPMPGRSVFWDFWAWEDDGQSWWLVRYCYPSDGFSVSFP